MTDPRAAVVATELAREWRRLHSATGLPRAPDLVAATEAALALAAEGLDIATAKIATDLDHALDAFYVTDRAGRKVEDPTALARIRESVERALAGGDPLDARPV